MSAGAVAGGIALGAAAACCFDGAVALQALEARALPDSSPARLMQLVRRPRWLAATGLAIAGWPLQIAALAIAPLTVVQPALAIGLVLLLVLGARLLHEPVRARDFAAVGTIVAGLALLAWTAPAERSADAGAAALAVGGLAAIAAVPWLRGGRLPGWALIAAAGCGYAASGLGSKLLTESGLVWALPTAAVAGLALADEMAALQRSGAARVAAGAFALQTAVPVLLAPTVTGERWSHPVAIIAGLALVVGASLQLGAAAPVRRLITH
jgi:hypothetical protein